MPQRILLNKNSDLVKGLEEIAGLTTQTAADVIGHVVGMKKLQKVMGLPAPQTRYRPDSYLVTIQQCFKQQQNGESVTAMDVMIEPPPIMPQPVDNVSIPMIVTLEKQKLEKESEIKDTKELIEANADRVKAETPRLDQLKKEAKKESNEQRRDELQNEIDRIAGEHEVLDNESDKFRENLEMQEGILKTILKNIEEESKKPPIKVDGRMKPKPEFPLLYKIYFADKTTQEEEREAREEALSLA